MYRTFIGYSSAMISSKIFITIKQTINLLDQMAYDGNNKRKMGIHFHDDVADFEKCIESLRGFNHFGSRK